MRKVILLLAAALGLFLFTSFDDEYTFDRDRMVEYQIRKRGIADENVLSAIKSVKRHNFVPSNLKERAYEDRPLPIGYGQTISQPYIVALMTELLELKGGEKVLEIGTGSGYQAAVLSRIVEKVYTVEIYRELYEQVKERFSRLGYSNIEVKNGDGYYGWEEFAPYDALIVTCAPAFVPPPLIKQLAVGGIMVIPVGPPFTVQQLLVIKKIDSEKIETTVVTDVIFVPLIRKQ